MSSHYRKALTLLVFVFALSLAFYFAFSSTSTLAEQTRYSCRASDGACVVDPNGGYTTSNCDNACSAAGGGIPSGSGGLPGIDLTIQGVFKILYAFACWLWSAAMILLVIFIIIAGLRFMYAGDNQSAVTSAKTNFKYVIIGAIVVMGTFVIISTVAYNVGVDISFVPFSCSGGSGAPPIEGEACTVDSDCPSGQVCSGDAQSGGGVCVPAGGGICGDNVCDQGEDCQVSQGILCCPSDCSGNAITHLGCVNNACRQINGAGADDCTACSGLPNWSENHSECRSGVCIVVPGVAGNSTCADDSNCANRTQAHLVCQNNACTVVNGAGFQNCGGDNDCR